MLLLPCPYCGNRAETEFIHGGAVPTKRPDPTRVDDVEWVEHLTVVPNPLGPVQESWWHVRGCGEWFELWRDTVTHDIVEGPGNAG